jgi:hypothetical protein
VNWQQLCKLADALPEVVQDIWYRAPALKVRGKGFVRLREELESVAFVIASVDEQEFLIATQPELYYITDHYRGHAMVLARLSKLSDAECRLRLQQGFRLTAPKSLLKALESPTEEPTPPVRAQQTTKASAKRRR